MGKKEEVEDLKLQIKELEDKYSKLRLDFDTLNSEFQEVKNKVTQNKKEKKLLQDNNKPKKNKSAYIYFCNEYRINNPGQKNVLKLAGKEWTNIRDDKELRKKYDEMADQDKERYISEIKKSGNN